MANVLVELFGDIADAIRTKTGGTDKMSPAAFPEKISAIEAGGGGSLPAGIYWRVDSLKVPNAYRQKWFMYNGVLHAWTLTATGLTGSNTVNVYKYVDGAWKSTVTAATLNRYGFVSVSFVEFGGKVHVIGAEAKEHYTYDEINGVVRKNDIPNGVSVGAVFVQDGKLKSHSANDGKVYVWDESADTWATEAKIADAYIYYYFYTVDNVTYACGGKWNACKVNVYENGALTEKCALPNSVYMKGGCVIGARIYSVYDGYSTTCGTLYAYDTETNTLAELGNAPDHDAAYYSVLNTFEQLRLCGFNCDATNSVYNFVMCEVEGDAENG